VNSWRLDTICSVDELEPILAIEQKSFRWPWGRRSFEGELACQGACNFIVRSSGGGIAEQVVAYTFLRRVVDELHILKIAVSPAWREKGIATWLMTFCLQRAVAHGATSAYLEVRPSNIPAVALYEKLGFEVIGRRHKYYADSKEDALVMIKNLKEAL
jgi:ribosomal-protein-alanine N-acetyltransferase